ncbi:uroporphyrinogen-III synthase [Puniceicoccus vermicola]|uniref:Uroporphyrinogen-III synthase n=1 Tax=Puniceicoccus vermicola TaxID=388746 RepID=A0A7X1E4R3_9BACT|nr:uroporphyrinogen-III synthase [Puniceicoccus vermicola]MBC2602329.1 uroporphyrinogen-III synthase [Puniceicoccus vermicola]
MSKTSAEPSAHLDLDWQEVRPMGYVVGMSLDLANKRICVTRARTQSGGLASLLESRGAEVVELPLIEVVPTKNRKVLEEVLEQPGVYDWIIFTSANGVRHFFADLVAKCEDLRAIGFARIACVGKATADAVRKHRLRVDLLPEESNAESLAVALLETKSLDSARVLIVAGNRNRDTLSRTLEEEGHAIVDIAEVYETKLADLAGAAEAVDFRTNGADAILFTSASTVEAFAEQASTLQLEKGARFPKAFSIGPMTSEALAGAGIPLQAEAPEASLEALVDVVATHLNS